MEQLTDQEIRYAGMESPIGRLWVAVSERGVCRIAFEMPEADFVADLRRQYGGSPRYDEPATAAARGQLSEYLAGQRTEFDLPLDLEGVTPFRREALAACAAIPYGETRQYAELAKEIGRRGAARAVGGAMATNPLPLVIPCHRVLRAGGALGGFGGGLEVKRYLLDMEAAAHGILHA